MVNLHSPIVTEQVGLTFVRLWHLVDGIYFWEFFSTLDYEWRVFRGHLRYRWTIWIYTLARVACLMAVVLNTLILDVTTRLHCQLLVSSIAVFFCLSSAASSILVILRMYDFIDPFAIAIWNRNKAVMATAIGIWVFGIGFHINALVRLRSAWDPLLRNCFSIKTEGGLLGLLPTVFADLALLLIMLVGLLLLRRSGGGMFGLTPILMRQAVIWLSLGLIFETPPVVIAVLSTNAQFNSMLLTPALIAMTVASTRMHRSLVDYASGFPDVVSARENDKLPMGSDAFTKTKRARIPLDSLNQIEVTVHTDFEEHTTTQVNDHDSYNTTNEHVHEKPNVWHLSDDVEHGM